jgi:ankyrin repeat protein
LIAGAKVLRIVQVLIIKSKLKSGNIGKNLLGSRKINHKIDRLMKKKQLDISADKRLEEFEEVPESDTDTPFGAFGDVGEDERSEEFGEMEDSKDKRLEEFDAAVKWGSFKYLLSLIEQGVDYHPHIRKSLLLLDTWYDWQKAVLLIRLGADINTSNDKGETPLINAARIGAPKLIQVLIAAGADAKTQSQNGGNALIYLIHGLGSSRIKDNSFVILSQICDINACDNEGMTALMHAIKRSFDTRVNYLLKKGASIMNGHNVIEWANKKGASES